MPSTDEQVRAEREIRETREAVQKKLMQMDRRLLVQLLMQNLTPQDMLCLAGKAQKPQSLNP